MVNIAGNTFRKVRTRMVRATAMADRLRAFAPLCAVLAAGLMLFTPSLADAQYVPDYFPVGVPGYDKDMGVTVVTRVRPLYEQAGMRLGSFIIRPNLNEGIGYNSNINGTSGGPSSWFVETNPSLQINSDWGRNALGAYLSADSFVYPQQSNQNQVSWQGGIGGAYTIGRGDLTLAYAHLSLFETPTEIGAPRTATPLPYTVDDVRTGYTFDFGRWSLSPNFEFQHYQYGSAIIGGVVSDQSFRDEDAFIYGGSLRYDLSGKTGVLVVLRGTSSQFVQQPNGLPSLSSNSGAALAGIDYKYDGLWRYQLLVGFEVRTFANAAVKTHTSPILQGTVIYTPTGLTTLTATALRTIEDPTTASNFGFNYTRGQLRVDHEYLRNVLLDGEVGIENASYIGGGSQTYYYAGTGLTWLINRNMRLSAHYQFTEGNNGSGVVTTGPNAVGSAFNQHLVLVQLSFGL